MRPSHAERALLLLVAVLTSTAVSAAQSSVLVDLGTASFPSGAASGATWNDIDAAGLGQSHVLVDETGAPSGITWSWPQTSFAAANSAGTTSPVPESPLAQFPISATRDVAYGQNLSTTTIRLDGLPASTTVDLTFAASRMGVGDTRSTDYLVQGFNGGAVTLNASNNQSETVTVSGVLPDASGAVTVSVRAAPSNDNPGTHYYYLGGVRMVRTVNPSVPPVLGFPTPLLDFSRPEGGPPVATTVTLAESVGAAPSVTLTAVDPQGGAAPSWLTHDAVATVGAPFSVGVDPSGLAQGDYEGLLRASAPGYPDADLTVRLAVRDPGTLNLLFYGNSYSQGNQGMPTLAGLLAEEAGHPAPRVVAKLVGGQDLSFHLNDPGQAAAITDALPLGEQWDFVVLQGHSLEATSVFGDPAGFRADALAILNNVRAHSPAARCVLFQTWARGPGSSFYPGGYPDPPAMHADIQANYRLAAADMDAAHGTGTASVAAAGDGVWLRAFDPLLYTADWSHPTPPTTLLTAMTVYQAIWRERICDLGPDFAGGGDLVQHLAGLGLGAVDWNGVAGFAERVADAELRRYPGSGDDLLLASGVDAPPTPCPLDAAGIGAVVEVALSSPNGSHFGRPAFVLLDVFATGAPPGMVTPWPEVHLDPTTALVMASTPTLDATGLGFSAPVPGSFPGTSLLVQGAVLGPSGSPVVTDAHELQLE